MRCRRCGAERGGRGAGGAAPHWYAKVSAGRGRRRGAGAGQRGDGGEGDVGERRPRGGEAGGEDEFLLPSPRHVCGEVWRGARGAPRGARRCAVRAVRAARGLREWGWRCAASERVRAAVPGRPGAAAERLCAHLKAFAARS